MKKTIIFVSGTVRSGTTYLNIVLSNLENAISLGEVHGLFYPIQEKHLKLIKILNQEGSEWSRIIEGGSKKLYQNLSREFPEVKIFIDSSKDILWLMEQMKSIPKEEFNIIHILIHKQLKNLAISFNKRGKLDLLIRVYVKVHRLYFSLVEDPIIVSYERFVAENNYREQVFKKIGLGNIEIQGEPNIRGYNFFGSDSIKNYGKIGRPSTDKENSNNLTGNVIFSRKALLLEKLLSNENGKISEGDERLRKYGRLYLQINALKDRVLRFMSMVVIKMKNE